MKIAVLVKHVPDTYGERQLDPATGRTDRTAGDQVIDEISERAVEVALAHKDHEKSTEVLVVTMGPAQATDALRKALAMGADRAIHVVDDALAGADLMVTATVLAAALRPEGCDLLIAGNESTDGRGGVLPALLAELLGLPLLSALRTVRLTDGEVSGTRITDAASTQVRAPLPAIISITEQLPDARFAGLRGIMAAKRKPTATVGLAELGLATPRSRTLVTSTAAMPRRTGGPRIEDDGTAARQLAQFLADRHLI
ncbi:electron transfer flavoprotein subunit beta/FixA family protein [Actinotalea sp. M2MS4P-6]|uniref:electron transfer flavoprotein subunit beta/FixA family protein n=1 Tax=Actinotalea sp. M2MS4P-6 TaxID=2983762 RepID=UPI0021E4ACFE|nr:electron transfer flavoprotein subunit beta/FixA family protein [Actinotalea sp. M2MS4P-6]MCV2393916.1 electron transfer flavoprotein subunit beta/FixA family protein [Actinotalea sp. M2MS4P-6]